jgi:hypothetical protein
MSGVSKTDVLYALLALDSYNRNREDGLRTISENGAEISGQIGNTTFVDSSDRVERDGNAPLEGSTASGFSASSYTLNGQNVLAFRGTDFPDSWTNVSQVVEFLKDFGLGWMQSFGVASPESAGPGGVAKFQPYYAQQFYDEVTGANRQLSLEEERAYIAAGQRVGELQSQLETGRSEKAAAQTQLPLAQEDLTNAQQVYDAALAEAGGNAGLVPFLVQDGLRGAQAWVMDLQARIVAADLKIVSAEAQLPQAEADLAAKQPHDKGEGQGQNLTKAFNDNAMPTRSAAA